MNQYSTGNAVVSLHKWKKWSAIQAKFYLFAKPLYNAQEKGSKTPSSIQSIIGQLRIRNASKHVRLSNGAVAAVNNHPFAKKKTSAIDLHKNLQMTRPDQRTRLQLLYNVYTTKSESTFAFHAFGLLRHVRHINFHFFS